MGPTLGGGGGGKKQNIINSGGNIIFKQNKLFKTNTHQAHITTFTTVEFHEEPVTITMQTDQQ